MTSSKAVLVLEDGTVFWGQGIGLAGITTGEVVFNTAMYGYQEILTDPSYAGQIISFTYPHIGNTGINLTDFESSKIHSSGVIIHKLSNRSSHLHSQQTLNSFLTTQGVVGIEGVDVRSLTKHLQHSGSQRSCIMSENIDIRFALTQARQSKKLDGRDLSSTVTCPQVYYLSSYFKTQKKVVVLDFGLKKSLLQELRYFSHLVIVPSHTSSQIITSFNPDAVILSNGPGDPRAMHYAIKTIEELLAFSIPILGVCLGCQLLALSFRAKIKKMHFGHHGSNHPVQDLTSKKVYITSQNHSFCISEDELPENLIVTHRSLFDRSIQGIKHHRLPIMAFQGHPEAGPGPGDIKIIYKEFFDMVNKNPQFLTSTFNLGEVT